MKKITLLLFLLTFSFGYSQQEVVQDFATSSSFTVEPFEGLGSASIVADPAAGGTRANGLKLVSASTGNPWQGATVTLLTSKIKLTTDKTVKIDVYATQAFTLLGKVEGGGTGPNSAASQSYTTPNTWQTLTFTFTQGLDGTAAANGEYSKIVFFPNWKATNDGFGSPANFSVHIDNIVAEKTAVTAPSAAVIVQDFATSSSFTVEPFEGLGSASIVADPAAGGTRANGLKLVSASTGNPWQGATVTLLTSKIKLTTDKTVKIDVYATQAFTLLGKVEGGGTGPNSAASQTYTTPNTWQTLTFTFTQGLDGTAAANGEYSKIVFFPNWKAANDGFGSPANFSVYIDNIFAEKTTVTAVVDATPASSKPKNYSTHLALLADITDTSSFTSFWNPSYYFGANDGTPDLDTTTGVNKAVKMTLNTGWGGGISTAGTDVTTDISGNDTVHIDYYVPSSVAAGSQGHQFYLDLISRTGGANTEAFYGVGTTLGGSASTSVDAVIVFDTWKSLDIPLSVFVGKGFSPATYFQFKLGASSDVRTKLVYFDNIFFYKASTVLGVNSFNVSNIKMYPNPVSSELTIEAQSTIQKIAIFNILGQEVLSTSPQTNSAKLQTSALSQGVYVITTTIDDVVSSSKFVKQ